MKVQKINLSQKVSNQLIEKFKANKGQTHVISVVDPTCVFAIKTYFVRRGDDDFLGAVHATDELMSIMGETPKVHYFMPVVEYTLKGSNVKDGYGMPIDFKFLKLGPSNYERFMEVYNSVEDISAIDISLKLVTGKEKWQEMNILPVQGSTGTWKKDPKVVKDVKKMTSLFENIVTELDYMQEIPAELVIKYLHGAEKEEIQKAVKALKNGSSGSFSAVTGGTQETKAIEAPKDEIPTVTPEVLADEEDVDLEDLVATSA
jgi:hypothetical protein